MKLFLKFSGAIVLLASIQVANAFDVYATVNGVNTLIGDLSDSNGYYINPHTGNPDNSRIVMTGSIFLNTAGKPLMNDAMQCQFRWFQVVTQDGSPPNYMGAPPTLPYVDPPAYGWDYQRNPNGDYMHGTPGDDALPFYENNAEYAANSEAPGSGGLGHNASQGISRIYDRPALNTTLQFLTYITYSDPTLVANKEIDLLAGYTWGGTNTPSPAFNISQLTVPPDAATLATLNTALGNDGFTGWKVITGYNIKPCAAPEPSSVAMMGLGIAALAIRRRKRSK